MRCYFMRRDEIWAVECLKSTDDRPAVKRALTIFVDRYSEKSDGFEVWDGDRLVFRYPSIESHASQLISA